MAADPALNVGDKKTFYAPALLSGTVRIMTIDALVTHRDIVETGNGDISGEISLKITIRQMPGFPYDVVVGTDGSLHRMTMNFGIGIIEMQPSDGPVEFGGAALALTGVIDAVGRPAAVAENAYRMPVESLERVPLDAFQQRHGDILIVRSAAEPGFAPDPGQFLQATPQLEIDEPELQQWVAKQLEGFSGTRAEKAEHLRLAVRGYIIPDLARGDASALEVLRGRRGDCTEYAHLLAAACRIAGIPARVEFGMVYASAFGGWGGHAWNSAWDAEQQRWLHLDAAYLGVERSQYIRTGANLEADTNADAALDAGMGLLMGKRLEVVPVPVK